MADRNTPQIGQSRRASLAEAVINVVIGYLVSLVGQFFIFPAFGLFPTLGQNLGISVGFTVLSLARSYGLRRFFNAWGRKVADPYEEPWA